MSDKTKIEWSDATWNPITGCSKVSEGCRNCYALKFAERFRGVPGHYFENGFDITLRPDKLIQPSEWKKPRKIFVNSMSDLFHESISFEYIFAVWVRMIGAPQHTYQILTKRPERMLEFFKWNEQKTVKVETFLPNIWIGVSVENQQAADERIHLLLKAPVAVRFLSCEPLLGTLDLSIHLAWKSSKDWTSNLINWVIVGGESGNKARPMHPDWARSLRDQCQSASVPFFFKQWGEWIGFYEAAHSECLSPKVEESAKWHTFEDGGSMLKVGKHNAGRELDGRTWDEFPEVRT